MFWRGSRRVQAAIPTAAIPTNASEKGATNTKSNSNSNRNLNPNPNPLRYPFRHVGIAVVGIAAASRFTSYVDG